MVIECDAVIVGSGPGGASCARELVKAGKQVVMLERGADHQMMGNSVATLPMVDLSNIAPIGHKMMIRGITTGGSSMLYCGTATRPAPFIKEQTGIDLNPYADEFEEELGIGPLPERLVGDAAKRMMDAARELNIDWDLLPKFINPEKCEPDCGDCMFGCKKGAKWTSREFVYESQEKGMRLFNRVKVDKVLRDDGKAIGVKGKGPGGEMEVRAQKVVISAGGLGTPVILKRSGIDEAGEGFFSDPLLFTYGVREKQEKGSIYDIPMTAGTFQYWEDEGFVLTDLAEPWLMMWSSMGMARPPRPDVAHKVRKVLGIMTKVKDPVSGRIDANGKIRKPFEDVVKKRLFGGDAVAREILLKAGCEKGSLFTAPIKAAHPGGTARIGHVVNDKLETKIKNLYVADASVVPDELGTPVVLLALCIGKYAAQNILADWN